MADDLIPLSRETPQEPRRWQSRSATVEASLPPLKARGIGELLDAALEILAARFWVCAGIAIVAWIPIRALMPFLRFDEALATGDTFTTIFSWLFSVIAPGAVRTLVAAMISLIVYGAIERIDVRPGAAMKMALKRSLALFLLVLVTALATFVGTCLFIVPGILVTWVLYVSATALVIEGVSIGEAIRRSYQLVQTGFWRWLGLVFVGGLFVLPLEIVGALGDNPEMREPAREFLGLGTASFEVLLAALSSILMGISTALSAILVTVFYLDCRIRREGHDLRLMLEAAERERAGPEVDR